jgi:type IV pilus assembly protein PilC
MRFGSISNTAPHCRLRAPSTPRSSPISFAPSSKRGKLAGNLDEVLGSLADTIEKQAQLNRTIRSAMTYPAVVLCVMALIFTAMIVFIVPVFQKLFTSLGGKLPLPTRILIEISQIITSAWVLVVIAVVVGC